MIRFRHINAPIMKRSQVDTGTSFFNHGLIFGARSVSTRILSCRKGKVEQIRNASNPIKVRKIFSKYLKELACKNFRYLRAPKLFKSSYYNQVFSFFLQYIWPSGRADIKARVLTTFALIIITKMIAVTVPFIFKYLVDSLSLGPEYSKLQISAVSIALCYGIARVFQHFAQEFRYALFMNVCQRSINEMNTRMFSALLDQTTTFHMAQRTGSLAAEVERGLKGISSFLVVFLFHLLPTLLEMILVCSIMTFNTTDANSACLLFFTVISALFSYTAFTYVVTEFRKKLRIEINTIDNNVSQKLLEGLTHHESIKLFGTRNFELESYDAHLRKSYTLSCKNSWSFALLNFGQAFIFSVSLTLIHLLCIPHVLSNQMTVGDLVLMNSLMLQLSFPLNFLGTIYREITQSAIDMKKLFSLLDKCGNPTYSISKTVSTSSNCQYKYSGGKIEFRAVSFAYPQIHPDVYDRAEETSPTQKILCDKTENNCFKGYHEVLSEVSFTIFPGQFVAFVGASGCGKSTILRLISQLYSPNKGKIFFDNQDSSILSSRSILAQLGYLTQDPILFHDTIYYNIAYGRKGEDMYRKNKLQCDESESQGEQKMVKNAAQDAHLLKTICEFREGFSTIVGERGTRISGGERQRIALARIFMKDPYILLADEPTSALDATTEYDIMQSLRKKCKTDGGSFSSRTLIVVAHRLNSIKDADCIFVMENGKIVEKGTHPTLLSRRGSLYDKMWNKQRKTTIL